MYLLKGILGPHKYKRLVYVGARLFWNKLQQFRTCKINLYPRGERYKLPTIKIYYNTHKIKLLKLSSYSFFKFYLI